MFDENEEKQEVETYVFDRSQKDKVQSSSHMDSDGK